jgi:hypothetical protein
MSIKRKWMLHFRGDQVSNRFDQRSQADKSLLANPFTVARQMDQAQIYLRREITTPTPEHLRISTCIRKTK